MTHKPEPTADPDFYARGDGWVPAAFETDLRLVFERRRADWRFGRVVYQVMVDRFAPSNRLDGKRAHYAHPRRLLPWTDVPRRGPHLPEERMSDNEVQFWGGDLESLRTRLDYVQQLGIDCLYLNPVFEAFSNHKYDGNDFLRIDPQFGTNDELRGLADDLHGRGMRLMLDGVFNHMGRRAPSFVRAHTDPAAPERRFFLVGPQYKHGYRGWRNVPNLPELNVEAEEVRDHLYRSEKSVVRTWLRDYGVDGWRLDVAPDLGFRWLAEITAAAHETRPDSVVIGECWNYPEAWLRVLDGVMNMHLRQLLVALGEHRFTPRAFTAALDRLVAECGTEGLLRSHLVLDNHDLPRLTHVVPHRDMRLLLRVLQCTLPGCPVIYYGSELGMAGGPDPENRAPMRWDLVADDNVEYNHVREMLRLRRENPALTIGDCRALDAERLVVFLRTTERATETIVVAVNPGDATVSELVPVRYSQLMDAAPLECLLTGERVVLHSGTLDLRLPPRSARVFRTIDRNEGPDYSMFKRVM